jgi:phosphoglycolate phosphatase
MTTIPFEIVGFDLDGTLLDTHRDLGAALNHAMNIAGRPPVPMDRIAGMVGGGGRTLLRKAMAQSGGVPEEAEFISLENQFIDYYAANVAHHTCLFPGGEAMLDGLAARGIKIAVVTNKLELLAVRAFEALGLTERFYTIIGGDTLGPGKAKPNRDLIDLMIVRAGGGRAVFVGDTTYDVGAARAAEIPCVAVSFGFNDLPPENLGADALIHHFDELIPALAKLH